MNGRLGELVNGYLEFASITERRKGKRERDAEMRKKKAYRGVRLGRAKRELEKESEAKRRGRKA